MVYRKYKNEPTMYRGVLYDSKKEASDALWLDSLKQRGLIKDWEGQVSLKLKVNGKLITTHVVDFLVTLKDGRRKFYETKGFETKEWKLKRKLTEALYPDMNYLVNAGEKALVE